jgi:glycosyltransferase involved in cell wall biosynthesis
MAQRKRVGLIFSYNENWIAGTYYILNIVHALKVLDDSEKPVLVILTETLDNFQRIRKETKYPYLEYFQYPFLEPQYSLLLRSVNKLYRILVNKNFITKTIDKPQLDFVYPKQINCLPHDVKKVNWIPDFQEDYLPQFFSEKEILKRKRDQKNIFSKGDVVVLSSEDAKSDFKRLYPKARAKTFVLPFAVTHPDYSKESIENLLKKYKLPRNYFFAPNQFWAHKNHIVILKALKKLKENGVEVLVAMSGRENDYRNKDNFIDLKKYITDNQLESQVVFLGFLPRTEQLCLFKNAQAIIQASLFEGWSTVIEDAKALSKFVIVSDLKVHQEQLQENAWFFDPNNFNELAMHMKRYQSDQPKIKELDYNQSIFEFGKKFNELVHLSVD